MAGIVASRLAERYHRPCLVVALGGEGGRGSGRSIPAFDLHAGLEACAQHLRRYGGHRAAAGFEIDPDRIDRFRRDFVRHAAATLCPEDLVPLEQVDAVAPGTALGLELAEELRSLAPFGHGNPEPRLMVPAARVTAARSMGDDGQHARFTLASAGSRAEAVAFRATAAALTREGGERCDAVVRLELNDWRGRVDARVALSALCPSDSGDCVVVGEREPFWAIVERELSADLDLLRPTSLPGGAGRAVRDRRGQGLAGVSGDLLSTGESVLVICADATRRRATLATVLAGLAGSCSPNGGGTDGRARAGLPATSWDALVVEPDLAHGYVHLLAIDPPPGRDALGVAETAPGAERRLIPPPRLGTCGGGVRPRGRARAARPAERARGRLPSTARLGRGRRRGAAYRPGGLRPVSRARLESVDACCASSASSASRRWSRAAARHGFAAGARDRADGARPFAAHRAYGRRLLEIERYLDAEAARWPAAAELSASQADAEPATA